MSEAVRKPYNNAVTTRAMALEVGETMYFTAKDHSHSGKLMSAVGSAIRRSPHLTGKDFSTSLWTAVRAGEVRYLVALERTK